MINFSIHNYKEWIGAYMEGNLSREDMLSAESFLQQHVHLMDEYLKELEEFSLEPMEIKYPFPASLEIVIVPSANIHANNFSNYFVNYYEGSLSGDEKMEVEKFLQLNPTLKKEFALYGAVRLVADPSVQFPNKELLYKRSRRPVPLFGSIAAAASVLLVVTLFLFWPAAKKDGIALKDASKIMIPILLPENIQQQNNSLVNNSTNDKKEEQVQFNNNYPQYKERLATIDMAINSPIPVEESSPSVADAIPEMALQDMRINFPANTTEDVAENKPKKKGLFNKLFSGEKTYIEDYVNATFTAFSTDKEDEKWVLKVDRDKDGKSKRVKFTSPLFSAKSRN
jgi:hypothetical protein